MKAVSLCGLGVFMLVAGGCGAEFPLRPDALIGKTKTEVIALAMEHAERTGDHKVNFAVETRNERAGTCHFENLYHGTRIGAERDGRLLESDVWKVFFTRESVLFGLLGRRERYIEVIFRDGRVHECRHGTISDGV